MTKPLIKIKSLAKAFGGNKVLQNVNFEVNKGEIVGLLGPNGSGKSTLLNTITGFEAIDSGHIIHNGINIEKLPAYKLVEKGMARTFQLPAMPEKMSVFELALAASTQHHGFWSTIIGTPAAKKVEQEAKHKAKTLLDKLLLTPVINNSAAAISGGQKKLLGIVCALMADPQVLFLDEPTAGVHPNLRSDIVSVLQKLNQQGMTIVVVEHDMHFIRELCHRCVVLDRGHIVADCHPDELSSNEKVLNAYLGTSRPNNFKQTITTPTAEAL